MKRGFLAIGALLAGVAAPELRAQQSAGDAAPPIEWRRGLVYARRDALELALDFARPASADRALPCVLAIHGGGWRQGRREDVHRVVERCVNAGFAAAAISYRLLPEHRFPAPWEDVCAAREFLAAHADELGLDPERCAAIGFSAGGHLALLLGTHDEGTEPGRPRVRAVGNFFGPTDLSASELPERAERLIADFLGASGDAAAPLRRAASPRAHVSAGDAWVRSFHGTDDALVPHAQATALHEALRAAGVPEALHSRIGAQHGWAREELEADLDRLLVRWRSELRGGGLHPLRLREDFESASEDGWWLSDAAAWRITGESGARALEIVAKRSSYAPKHRSPLHLAVRKDLAVESFVLDVDLRSTHASYGHRDLVLVCGWQDAEHFYYVHLGQQADATSHGVFLVDGAARRRLEGERGAGTPWGERWHRARLVRDVESGAIELYLDGVETPHLRAVDRRFLRGCIGVGSFDDTGRFDALRLYAAPGEAK
ncbi:MAG: alpha/beta hydrolase fold domain-containing protein [Planctomycetes bacterium]|nr:alpha/beta hydrolase fold domain-containing protein [Planctomycetota bacterium]